MRLRLLPPLRPRRAVALVVAGASLVATAGLPSPAGASTLSNAEREINERLAEPGLAAALGAPLDVVRTTPGQPGGYQHFANGASLYHGSVNQAFLVYGEIRNHWERSGWEEGHFGFPTSDEFADEGCGAGGRRSNFEGGYICWTPNGGTNGRVRFNLKVVTVDSLYRTVRARIRVGAVAGMLDEVQCQVWKVNGAARLSSPQRLNKYVYPHQEFVIDTDVTTADSDRAGCWVVGRTEGLNGEFYRGDNGMNWDYHLNQRWWTGW